MYSVCQHLANFAQSQPEKIALVAQGKNYNYSELYHYVYGFSLYLRKLGFQKSDCVVCKASATIEYWVACLGTQLAGGIFVPVEKDCAIEKMQAIVNQLTNVFAFISNTYDLQMQADYRYAINTEEVISLANVEVAQMEEVVFPRYDDAACILFTTGTTGTSKGVVIPHSYFVESAFRTKDIPYGRDTVILIPVPMNHSLGLGRSVATWAFGGTVVITDGLTDLLAFYNALTIQKVNAMAIAPSGLNYLITLMGEELFEYSEQLSFIEIGGEKMPYSLQESLLKFLPSVRLFIGYASTETGMVCSYEFSKYGPTTKRIGKPIEKTEILTFNENGEPICATKENPGFFGIRSDSMMKGYFNNPEETKKVLKGDVLMMSDYGYVDEEGFVCLLGRAGDVIISGGQKINPTEVEECALQSELFTECVCYGQSDEIFGKIVKLLVVMKPGVVYDEFTIKKYFIEHLENFKVPKVIEQVESVQRNKNGKIDRKFYANK